MCDISIRLLYHDAHHIKSPAAGVLVSCMFHVSCSWLYIYSKCDAFKFTKSMTISLQQWRSYRPAVCITDNPLSLRDPSATVKRPPYWMNSDITSQRHADRVVTTERIMTHDSVKFCIKDLLNS
jgi:hypothetical protein